MDTFIKIQAFKHSAAHHRSVYGLESLTGDPSKRPRTRYDAEIGCFRKSVLTFLQPPPHIRTVHQSMDATQTELIAQSVFTSNRLSWSSSNTPHDTATFLTHYFPE